MRQSINSFHLLFANTRPKVEFHNVGTYFERRTPSLLNFIDFWLLIYAELVLIRKRTHLIHNRTRMISHWFDLESHNTATKWPQKLAPRPRKPRRRGITRSSMPSWSKIETLPKSKKNFEIVALGFLLASTPSEALPAGASLLGPSHMRAYARLIFFAYNQFMFLSLYNICIVMSLWQ